MMVIVPRIAVVSCFSTTPFIYGIQHEDNLRAGLLLSDPAETIQAFSEHKADIALIPAAAMPSLTDARIVTEYCVVRNIYGRMVMTEIAEDASLQLLLDRTEMRLDVSSGLKRSRF